MKHILAGRCCILAIVFVFAAAALAQTPTPTATPSDDPIKIVTEEIQLNVMAQNAEGKFVPNLTPDDLLIVESGDPQKITSMKKVPASVLLLLDTGSEMNFVKKISVTRLLARLFAYNLSPDNTLSVMQYYDKIETVADWTTDRDSIAKRLDTKLFSGKRSRFADALNASVQAFASRPAENRHLVLITDGLENVVDAEAREKALQQIRAANITVHILSYTALEAEQARQAAKMFRVGDGKTKPRIPEEVIEAIVRALPDTPGSKINVRETVRQMYKSQAIYIWDIDNERRKAIRKKEEAWKNAEAALQELAEDTGGVFQAPEDPATLFKLAIETADAIDASYVVTYSPTKPVAGTADVQSRKVRVSTHCDGVIIRSRHKVTINRSTVK